MSDAKIASGDVDVLVEAKALSSTGTHSTLVLVQ